MPTNVYTLKDNGDLKLMAEIEETLEDEEAVELLLESAPRTRAEEFVVISGTMDDGVVSTVSQKETVTIKWASSRNGETEEVATPARASWRKQAEPAEEEPEEEEAPKPRRRGRPPGSKNKPKATTTTRSTSKPAAAKTTSSRSSARGGTKKKTGRISSFKRNPASDE